MKGKPVKVDQKQLDAQKALEEKQKKEEEERRMAMEIMKYQIVKLETGLELIITRWSLEQLWEATHPKEFVIEFLNFYMNSEKIIENFESIDLQIIGEFILYNYIFSKEECKLELEASLILVNIFFQVLINDNMLFGQQGKQKNKQNDLNLFKHLLSTHSIHNPPKSKKYFSPLQVQQILSYFQQGYFNHFHLYNYAFHNQQQTHLKKITLTIDKPLDILPLSQANMLNLNDQNNNNPESVSRKQQMEDKLKQEEEDLAKWKLKQEEEERLKREEDEKLDPRTLEIIRLKVAEAQQKINDYLKEREEQFNIKLDLAQAKKK